MELILTADVKSLGKKGDKVKVSDGYAKNFLLPRNLAIEANNANLNNLKGKNEAVAFKKQQEKEAAEAEAKKQAEQKAKDTKVKQKNTQKTTKPNTQKNTATKHSHHGILSHQVINYFSILFVHFLIQIICKII